MKPSTTKLQDVQPDTPASPNPTLETLESRVRDFLKDRFAQMHKAHFTRNNTIHYHQCCNVFTGKKHKSRATHTQSTSLTEFLGNKGKTTDLDDMVKACCAVSQKLTGLLHLSTPTYNTHHQDYGYVNKRLAEADQIAEEANMDPDELIASLRHKINILTFKNNRLRDELAHQTARADEETSYCFIYSAFLKYNGIDTAKVRQGWYPPGGRTDAPRSIGWPKYDLNGPAAGPKRQEPISLPHQAPHLENKAKP